MRAAIVTAEGLTLKEEAVVQAFLKCGDKSAAYIEVYQPKNGNPIYIKQMANRVFNRERVKKRIQDIVKKSESAAVFGLDQAMAEARQAFDLALSVEQPAAMVAATKLRATLMGILVEKRETTSKTVKDVPDEKLDEMIETAMKEAGYAITKAKA